MKIFALLSMVLLSGCATIINRPYDRVQFKGEPNATLYINDEEVRSIPWEVEISTKDQLIECRIESEGYEPKEVTLRTKTGAGWVVADILLTGGLGVIVDAATKKWKTIEVSEYEYSLEKIEAKK